MNNPQTWEVSQSNEDPEIYLIKPVPGQVICEFDKSPDAKRHADFMLDACQNYHIFPNGFTSWMETFYEVVEGITERQRRPEYNMELERNEIERTQNREGGAALYELAKEWTDEFERENRGTEWDGEWLEAIWAFIETKTSL